MPPDAPSNLLAVVRSAIRVDLSWTLNSTDELGIQIDRSRLGSGGPFEILVTLDPGSTTYFDQSATPGVQFCYRIRTFNASGFSDYSNVNCATTPTAKTPTERAAAKGGARQVANFHRDIAPETCNRIYDECMIEWLTSMQFRNQLPKVKAGWMSRQFGQQHEQHETDPKQPAAYPQVTLSKGAITPDLERRVTTDIVTIRDLPSGTNQRSFRKDDKTEVYVFKYPQPYSFDYQVDIYTKTMQDLRLLETEMMVRFPFTDTSYIRVPIPGYGDVFHRMTLDRVDNTSDLETGEAERELRKTLSMTLHGWIFKVPVVKKSIINAHAALIDAGSDEANLSEGSQFADFYCDPSNYNFNADASRLLSVTESPDFTPPNRVLLWITYNEGGFVEVNSQA